MSGIGVVWMLVLFFSDGSSKWAGDFNAQLACDRAGYEFLKRGVREDAWWPGREVAHWECKDVMVGEAEGKGVDGDSAGKTNEGGEDAE